MTESPPRARRAVGHKLALAVDPPRPTLSNGEPLVGLKAAAAHWTCAALGSLAVGRRARHGNILPPTGMHNKS